MCHVLLVLPLLALPVFWVFPMTAAAPIYGVVIGLSGAVYWFAIRAMNQPVQNGPESMIGEFGIVIECHGRDILVQARNELWQAVCSVQLCEGDRIQACGAEYTTLRIQRVERDCGAQ